MEVPFIVWGLPLGLRYLLHLNLGNHVGGYLGLTFFEEEPGRTFADTDEFGFLVVANVNVQSGTKGLPRGFARGFNVARQTFFNPGLPNFLVCERLR